MKRKLIILGALVAVIAAGGLGYKVWKRKTQSPEALFESGKKYFEQKKYREASIQFMNVVQKNPRHRDGRFFLARTYLAGGDVNGAARQLQALLEYYPDDKPARLELGGIFLMAGRTKPDYFHQAAEAAQKILAKDPNNVDALLLSGGAARGLQDYNGSVDILEKAINLDPNNSRAFISLGASQALEKNLPDAEKSFIKARDVNPKDKGAILSLANYYRATQDSAKAEAAFKDALALSPGDRQVYLQAADFYSRARRFDDVEKVLQNAQTKSPDDPFPSLTLATVYEAMGRSADVRKLLLDLKTKFPKDLDVATRLATNLMPDQGDRARVEIDQIIKTAPKNPAGYVLLGESQYRSGKFDDAEATLGKDPALNSRFPQVHFILGNLATRKGKSDQAIEQYQKSLAVNAGYVPARIALAQVYMSKGKNPDAREEVRKVLEGAPGYVPARLLKTTLDMADKNYPEAEKELLALEKEQPGDRLVQRQLGIYYVTRGKNAEAEKSLTKALELSPGSEESFRDLISLYLNTKQADRALQKINSIPDDMKQPFHYELLGVVNAASSKPQDAEAAFRKALEKEPGRGTTSQLLFDLYMQQKRYDEARKMLDDRIAKSPANNPSKGSAFATRAMIDDAQGKPDDAKKDYEQALQADPNQPVAANNLAYMLAEQGRELDTALKYAQQVRNQHPEDPNIADTLGWVYYKLGRTVLAKDAVKFAASKQPDNPQFQYHLGIVYKANNERTEAETALKKALASKQDFKERSQADAALKDIDHWRHLVSK